MRIILNVSVLTHPLRTCSVLADINGLIQSWSRLSAWKQFLFFYQNELKCFYTRTSNFLFPAPEAYLEPSQTSIIFIMDVRLGSKGASTILHNSF